MAYGLSWSSEASEDLAEIYAFISRDSLMYAVGFVQRVISKAESLTEMPERGRVVPENEDPAVREALSATTVSSTESGQTSSVSSA